MYTAKKYKTALILILIILSCTVNSQGIADYYCTPELEYGFFRTKIILYNDSTFYYNFSGDLINDESSGFYSSNGKIVKLYLPKKSDTIFKHSDNIKYDLIYSKDTSSFYKNEDHYSIYNSSPERVEEYLIGRNKLIPRNIQTGKFVRRGKLIKMEKSEWDNCRSVGIRYVPPSGDHK